MAARLEYYRDKAREWRWRFYAKNGRIIADSGEGYRRIASAEKAWLAILRALDARYTLYTVTVLEHDPRCR